MSTSTSKKKIILTGGHHNSALVVAKDLIRLGHEVIWFGHRYASHLDKHDSAEYVEVTGAGIPFFELNAGKIGRAPKLSSLLKIPGGLYQAHELLRRLKPDCVLSFGSYLGLTTALSAYSIKIPVFIHEQTTVAGTANQLAARFGRRVYLTWESSLAWFDKKKALVVGLPLRDKLLEKHAGKFFKNSSPTILIVGGKQGSHTINSLIFSHLKPLLSQYNLVHQTGTSSATGDYQKAQHLHESLSPDLAAKYEPRGYLDEDELAPLLSSSDLVIGRSGAHTTYELGILGKKSILIPFLATPKREQLHNARMLESAGISSIILESELSYQALTDLIDRKLGAPTPPPLPLPKDASHKLISDLLSFL
ncbi:MAG: hypothetical protein UY18_C0013G0007 [Microgenomates group bacterium GW2011_GWF2_47_9]|nr:MAG: hypothetical protein UY18_C0013G0007 [Microgenomates group bacterium GW2011_GWF2_47_9]